MITPPKAKDLEKFSLRVPGYAKKEKDIIFQTPADTSFRIKFGQALNRWFCEHFKGETASRCREYIFVEGLNRLPRDSHRRFFDSPTPTYPDAALIMPNRELKIAIELDHVGRSTLGSKIKAALTKGAFNVISGEYDKVLLLFYASTIGEVNIGENERKVLSFYETHASTFLFLL